MYVWCVVWLNLDFILSSFVVDSFVIFALLDLNLNIWIYNTKDNNLKQLEFVKK